MIDLRKSKIDDVVIIRNSRSGAENLGIVSQRSPHHISVRSTVLSEDPDDWPLFFKPESGVSFGKRWELVANLGSL